MGNVKSSPQGDLAGNGKAILKQSLSDDVLGLADQMKQLDMKPQCETPTRVSGYTLKVSNPKQHSESRKQRVMENSTETHDREQAQKPVALYVSKNWTPAQDEALRAAVELHDGKNWKAIAEAIPGRTHVQCLQRWKKVLQPGLVKGHWTDDEDELLMSLVTRPGMGVNSWVAIAAHIPGRTAKQCRERWSLNLDPSIKKGPWSPLEDAQLLELHSRFGSRWADLAKFMEGRTENAVKTRYKSLLRAQQKQWTIEEDREVLEAEETGQERWAAIASRLPGRSKNAIRLRWKHLNTREVSLSTGVEAHEWYPEQQVNYLQVHASDEYDQATNKILADILYVQKHSTNTKYDYEISSPHGDEYETNSPHYDYETNSPHGDYEEYHPAPNQYSSYIVPPQIEPSGFSHSRVPCKMNSADEIKTDQKHLDSFGSLGGIGSSNHSLGNLADIFHDDFPFEKPAMSHQPIWTDLNVV